MKNKPSILSFRAAGKDRHVLLVIIMSSVGNSVKTKESATVNQSL